jgi:hypothetical protein
MQLVSEGGQRMLRKILAIPMLFAVISIASCGSGELSSLQGNYQGTFTTLNSQSGTLSLDRSLQGTVAGTAHNDTTGQTAAIAGSIDNAGATTLTFAYPGLHATATGTFTTAANGHLTATLTQSTGGTITLDLVKQ